VELVRWEGDETRPRLAERARIVLACAEGVPNSVVAAGLGWTTMTVAKWRRRFAEAGLDGLADATRSGRPKDELVLTDTERAKLTRWSRRAKSTQALALRWKIVLGLCAGMVQ
jgi:transposase